MGKMAYFFDFIVPIARYSTFDSGPMQSSCQNSERIAFPMPAQIPKPALNPRHPHDLKTTRRCFPGDFASAHVSVL